MGFDQATTSIFTVKDGEEVTHSISLAAEDRVLIQLSTVVFSAVGEASNPVNFSMVFPNEIVKDFGE